MYEKINDSEKLIIGCIVKDIVSDNIYIWFGKFTNNSYFNERYIFHSINDLNKIVYFESNNFDIILNETG
jgi:hypothetical protein